MAEQLVVLVCKHDSVVNHGWDFPWYKHTFDCCRHFRFDPSAAALMLAGATGTRKFDRGLHIRLTDQWMVWYGILEFNVPLDTV